MNPNMGGNTAADMTAATEQAAQQIRELTERFIESAKTAGNQSLDAYEKSLRSLVEFQEQAAGASQLDWVSSIASAHARFVQDVSAAYVKAAREMLK
jgi:predicted RNA-binding Zn ribbon-like protein